MHAEWLTATTYNTTERLISLINDFLLGMKLRARGADSLATTARMEDARRQLDHVFSQIESLSTENSVTGVRPVMGASAALCYLARTMIPEYQLSTSPPQPQLSSAPRIRELLLSNDLEDETELMQHLSDLRRLIEQQMVPDVREILGQM